MGRKKIKEAEIDAIPLFDDGATSNKSLVKKKSAKKLKKKVWLYVQGWTRANKISAIHEISENDLAKFNNLIKAIKSNKSESNWNQDLAKVYEMYPKIKTSVVDEFEAYVPNGFDLCIIDESRTIVETGSADSIDSVTVLRGTEEDII